MEFVETHLGLSSTLKSAKEQMEAAAKAARDAARKSTATKPHGSSAKSVTPGLMQAQTEAETNERVRLESEHDLLPAAFYDVLTKNLYKWMRVYDYLDAQEHAETWMEDLSDEELEASVYRKVDIEIPACIKERSKTLNHKKALNLLHEIQPRTSVARELIRNVLEMNAHGQGHEHAWPGQISEKDVPGIDTWLTDADYSRPGCLITWYENDAINGCFDEEAQQMGENGPCQPNVALPIHLDKSVKELDEEVRRVFDHASAMLRSLASAAKIVELIRNLYDEYLREHRLESGLPVEPGAAGVREEQL